MAFYICRVLAAMALGRRLRSLRVYPDCFRRRLWAGEVWYWIAACITNAFEIVHWRGFVTRVLWLIWHI